MITNNIIANAANHPVIISDEESKLIIRRADGKPILKVIPQLVGPPKLYVYADPRESTPSHCIDLGLLLPQGPATEALNILHDMDDMGIGPEYERIFQEGV